MFLRWIFKSLGRIENALWRIEQKMVTQAQLDQALADLGTSITTLGTAVTTGDADIEALIAKISASGNTDFTNEVNAVLASKQQVSDAINSLGSAHTDATTALGG